MIGFGVSELQFVRNRAPRAQRGRVCAVAGSLSS